MTRFQVLQAITDVHEYVHGVWSMAHSMKDEQEFENVLRSELSEEGRQCMLKAARSKDYPLSLERLQ